MICDGCGEDVTILRRAADGMRCPACVPAPPSLAGVSWRDRYREAEGVRLPAAPDDPAELPRTERKRIDQAQAKAQPAEAIVIEEQP